MEWSNSQKVGEIMLKWLRKKFDDWNYSCPYCGCKEIESIAKDYIEHMVCEEQEVCTNCGKEVRYWAYGSCMYPSCRTEEIQLMLRHYVWKVKQIFHNDRDFFD